MQYIGNDIVDLNIDLSQHPRFDDRVFTPSEQAYITEVSPTAKQDRCLAWAAKEAAYKMMKQENSTTVFSPREFEWHHPESVIIYRQRLIPISYKIDALKRYVHAWCFNPHGPATDVEVAEAWFENGTSSEAVRLLARNTILQSKNFVDWLKEFKLQGDVRDVNIFRVEKINGKIPSAFWDSTLIPVTMSFSHDGSFAAVAVYWWKIAKDL